MHSPHMYTHPSTYLPPEYTHDEFTDHLEPIYNSTRYITRLITQNPVATKTSVHSPTCLLTGIPTHLTQLLDHPHTQPLTYSHQSTSDLSTHLLTFSPTHSIPPAYLPKYMHTYIHTTYIHDIHTYIHTYAIASTHYAPVSPLPITQKRTPSLT